jgi:hypothetical protein
MNSLTNVHVTIGGGKMKGIPSINTSSLNNSFCKLASEVKGSVCSICYSNKLSKFRKNLEVKLNLNSEVLSSRLLEQRELPAFNNLFARFNSFGEIINETHMANLIAIAERNPYTTFGLWTKRSDIVMKFPKIDNIKYVYSVSKLDGKLPKPAVMDYFDKAFVVVSDKKDINCMGSCMDCKLCYTTNDTVLIREQKK